METPIHTDLNLKDLNISKTRSFENFNFWRRIRFWILDWFGHLPLKCRSCCSTVLRCQNEAFRKSPGTKFWGVDCLRDQVLKESLWYFTVMQKHFSRDFFFKKYQATLPGRTKSCLLNLSSYISILQDLEWEIKEKLIWKLCYVYVKYAYKIF